MNRKRNLRLTTMQKVSLGFLGVIFWGGVLLYLPISNLEPIRFIDALFTSTTAVCVTGLVTVIPAAQFTLFGKAVLLFLIQIGGWGVIACFVMFLVLLKRKITVKERVMIHETYGVDELSGMVRMVIRIIQGTLIVEGVGALFYSFQFVPEYGVVKGIGYSIFHSVSAFCNAGIDILGENSFQDYVSNPIISITTMTLIVLGGLGFLVWRDIRRNLKDVIKNKRPKSYLFRKLPLHSKIVITMTMILILGGTVLILLMEYNNPKTLGNLGWGTKIMAAMFQSVTTRTAGYVTLPQGSLRIGTLLVSCILMFVGGSPMGTAGGVKTTTVATLLLTCKSFLQGGRQTESFGRRIPTATIRTGFCIVFIFFTVLITGTVLMSIAEPTISLQDILYETTSALATVGLTADLTPNLSDAGKVIDIALMYIGRTGPITIALAFGSRLHSKDSYRELPERNIMVG
ncbi:potassium transporter KtrB [Lachnospiraceae bacterium OttesenSCG-928-E19]|nr:potassium transporter KtrB [Lachnospiraceae bacterium OttesenSCG-928-E19]